MLPSQQLSHEGPPTAQKLHPIILLPPSFLVTPLLVSKPRVLQAIGTGPPERSPSAQPPSSTCLSDLQLEILNRGGGHPPAETSAGPDCHTSWPPAADLPEAHKTTTKWLTALPHASQALTQGSRPTLPQKRRPRLPGKAWVAEAKEEIIIPHTCADANVQTGVRVYVAKATLK